MVLIAFIWFLLSFSGWCCCHCFMPIFIRDRRKKSFPKNPTELGGARSMWEVMTKTCKSFLRAANGSLSKCLRVPSWRRKPVVGKHQATVCPTLRGHWRLHILDLVPHSQPQVLEAVRCRVEGCQAGLVGPGALCGRGQSRRLRSCDVIVRSRGAWRSGRYRTRFRSACFV